jgi:NADPH2:quinone reductase
MKAWQVSEWCEPEQMTLVAMPAPDPGSGEVRIRNHAAALNFFDILQIQGSIRRNHRCRLRQEPKLPV